MKPIINYTGMEGSLYWIGPIAGNEFKALLDTGEWTTFSGKPNSYFKNKHEIIQALKKLKEREKR
jgi:hypothetical protein